MLPWWVAWDAVTRLTASLSALIRVKAAAAGYNRHIMQDSIRNDLIRLYNSLVARANRAHQRASRLPADMQCTAALEGQGDALLEAAIEVGMVLANAGVVVHDADALAVQDLEAMSR